VHITIRPYQHRDLNAAAHLWFESWRSTDLAVAQLASETAMRERIDRELASGWSLYLAENEAGELLGFLALKTETKCLDQIFVAPRAQRQGVGQALLDFSKQLMPAGFWLRTAVDNIGACRFYERHGFKLSETATHPTLGHRTVIYSWPSSHPITAERFSSTDCLKNTSGGAGKGPAGGITLVPVGRL
jgi:ribosomal protein S18 acetylase RimI-like enzyme